MKVHSPPAKTKVEQEIRKQVAQPAVPVMPTGTLFANTRKQLVEKLKNGTLSTSSYTGLDAKEKLFVELVVMANYTSEQAVRMIDPTCEYPDVIGNRLITDKRVMAVIADLNKRKNIKMETELVNVRELALKKLQHLMNSEDESMQLAASKILLEKSIDMMKEAKRGEEPVGGITLSIQVAPPAAGASSDPIIIDEDLDPQPDFEFYDKDTGKTGSVPAIKPYVLSYEGVNSYEPTDGLSEDDLEEEFDDADSQVSYE